jgi:hypothetical protein
MNRNTSHSLICNRGRRDFIFAVTQLREQSPNFTEPENSELYSQKLATGRYPKQVEPTPHFHTVGLRIKHQFHMLSSHLYPHLPNGPSIGDFLDHAVSALLTFPSDTDVPPISPLSLEPPTTYMLTSTNDETIYPPIFFLPSMKYRVVHLLASHTVG